MTPILDSCFKNMNIFFIYRLEFNNNNNNNKNLENAELFYDFKYIRAV